MLARYSFALLTASGVTLALFLLMHALVSREAGELPPVKPITFVDIFPAKTELTPKPIERIIERPTPPEAPPPVELPRGQREAGPLVFNPPQAPVTQEPVAPLHAPSDGDRLPLLVVQPDYPRPALERGIEGYVLVALDVTAGGTVAGVRILEADPPRIFDQAALKAAAKFRYKPKVVDGRPVATTDVRYLFTFTLDQ